MTYKVIILDFDGVLVESVGIKDEAFGQLFPERPECLGRIMAYHLANQGVSRYVKFRFIVEEILRLPYDEAFRDRLKRRFDELTKRRIIECPSVDGAEEFLNAFAGRIPLYIASSTPRDELLEILEARKLTCYFKGVYGAPMLKAEMLREIVKREGLAEHEAVFVGDSLGDYGAAIAMGVRFVGRVKQCRFEGIEIPRFNHLGEIRKFLMRGESRAINRDRQLTDDLWSE